MIFFVCSKLSVPTLWHGSEMTQEMLDHPCTTSGLDVLGHREVTLVTAWNLDVLSSGVLVLYKV